MRSSLVFMVSPSLVAEFYLTCALFVIAVLWSIAHWNGINLIKLACYVRCLYFAAAPIFLAQAVGIEFTLVQQLSLLGTPLVTSKEGAGVAGSAIAVPFRHWPRPVRCRSPRWESSSASIGCGPRRLSRLMFPATRWQPS
jgi:Na+/H+-dicarboxylate symporter